MLFKELSVSLDKTHEDINDFVSTFLKGSPLDEAINI